MRENGPSNLSLRRLATVLPVGPARLSDYRKIWGGFPPRHLKVITTQSIITRRFPLVTPSLIKEQNAPVCKTAWIINWDWLIRPRLFKLADTKECSAFAADTKAPTPAH